MYAYIVLMFAISVYKHLVANRVNVSGVDCALNLQDLSYHMTSAQFRCDKFGYINCLALL